jgi:hypothetical protein
MADLIERLRETLPGIAQEECRGDNLAILLAGYFEPGVEDDELDDSGTWKQGAIDASNRVLDAIHAHYATALSLEREAREKAERMLALRVENPGAERYWESRWRDAEASLAEAKRLQREDVLTVYDECESVAVPAHPAPYRQVELYRQAIRQLKARFLSQEPNHER